jgi:hypothetical protein
MSSEFVDPRALDLELDRQWLWRRRGVRLAESVGGQKRQRVALVARRAFVFDAFEPDVAAQDFV